MGAGSAMTRRSSGGVYSARDFIAAVDGMDESAALALFGGDGQHVQDYLVKNMGAGAAGIFLAGLNVGADMVARRLHELLDEIEAGRE